MVSVPILAAVGLYTFLSFKMAVRRSHDVNIFTVGTAAGYAPFVSINTGGDYEGFDIDVARALANQMGKELEIKDLGSMTSLFLALEQNSIDVIIWGLSITQERLKKVAMVRYQGETVTTYPLIFWQRVPEHIVSIEDMIGMTICVEPGSSQESVLDNYPFINKKFTEKVDDALLNIQYKKAEAALVEPAIAHKFKAKYPEIVTRDVPLALKDQVHGIGIAIKRTNGAVIQEVQQAVDELRSSGVIEHYAKEWGIS
jgi:ABC-type amino acid transport substrate-binding protein